MYVAIDTERMVFVAKHPHLRTLANIVFIENPYRTVDLLPYSSLVNLGRYNIGQLFKLWQNTTGQGFPPGHNVVRACQALASALPCEAATPAEAEQQSAWLELGAEPYSPHECQPGKRQPAPRPAGWLPEPLTWHPVGRLSIEELLAGYILHEAAPPEYSAHVDQVCNSSNQLNPGDDDMALTEEQKAANKAQREAAAQVKKDAKVAAKADLKAKREADKAAKLAAKPQKAAKLEQPKQNDVVRPKSGTACAKLWDIFDSLSANSGAPTPIAAALELARSQGINDSTTRTQYARWRKFNGVSGRIVAVSTTA